MKAKTILLAAALALAATSAGAAGMKRIDVPAADDQPALTGAVWYPCARPTSDVRIGPRILSVAEDCPMLGERLPLIVISHGRGGSFLGHEDTAGTLADAGFVVVAINHPGDTARDLSRTDELSVFVERPADIRRVIDFVLGPWPDAAKVDAGRIGVFGFSRGGYTGLVAIGANPHFGRRLRMCEGKDGPPCDLVHKGELPELAHDPRIKAAVIADPLSVFFDGASFGNVKIPVQLWGSERGGDGVTPESLVGIANQLPTKPEFHVVPNSRHFSFIAPCSAESMKIAPEICSDATGFDRVAFHQQFNADVLAFFRTHLPQANTP